MAALYSSGSLELAECGSRFGAFHVSGGTTELVRVTAERDGFRCDVVGGTRDLNAGQVIDRVAVAMGLPFPGGAHLEERARKYEGKIFRRKPSMDGCYVNLSGAENLALKLYKETSDPCAVAAFVFDHIGDAVARMARAYNEKYGEGTLVFAGGVMSNSIIRARIEREFDARFAEPMLSCDNGVGIAALALRSLGSPA
jgi:N6-L-threonylcarbamoyladenine synthase